MDTGKRFLRYATQGMGYCGGIMAFVGLVVLLADVIGTVRDAFGIAAAGAVLMIVGLIILGAGRAVSDRYIDDDERTSPDVPPPRDH